MNRSVRPARTTDLPRPTHPGRTAPPVHPVRSALRLVGWLVFLGASHAALVAAAGRLPTPPVPWDLAAFGSWVDATGVAGAAFALLRLIALVTTWYLAGLTLLVVLARLSGSHPMTAVADRLALPFARRLLGHVLGAGLVLTLSGAMIPLTGGVSPAGASPAPSSIVLRAESSPADGPTIVMRAESERADPGVSMTAREDPAAAGSRSLGQHIVRATASSPIAMTARADEAATWTTGPGDHLWHIAATTLETRWQRPPTETEVGRYWKALVAENHDRFAVPGDPDLIHPGQVFVLPPAPSA